MDARLDVRLIAIADQIDLLKAAEALFLELEANRKPLYSQLFLRAEGKNVAEKEASAYDSKEWRDFMAAHVQAESDFNHERRRYELKLKAYDGEHLTMKHETPAIRRQA